MTDSPTYTSWKGMIRRCTNPGFRQWQDYGGRGITVCERWSNSFLNFLADMGERPVGTTLDRYPDNDGDYEPGNCRWAPKADQESNKRRRTHCKRGHALTADNLYPNAKGWQLCKQCERERYKARVALTK